MTSLSQKSGEGALFLLKIFTVGVAIFKFKIKAVNVFLVGFIYFTKVNSLLLKYDSMSSKLFLKFIKMIVVRRFLGHFTIFLFQILILSLFLLGLFNVN